MSKVSSLMRDQMESPLDRAVYWIEYVIRHDGAPHLRTASHKLSFIQRNLFDVLMFVFTLTFFFLFLVFYICRYYIFSRGGVRIISDQKKTN
jgi:glucuronosyltransferase